MIQQSDFDSKLLNRKVGKCLLSRLTFQKIKQLRKEARSKELDLVFIKVSPFNFALGNLDVFSQQGLELADVKVFLKRDLKLWKKSQDVQYSSVKQVQKEMGFKKLLPMVYPIADLSRFSFYFSKVIARKLYAAWLSNALSNSRCFNYVLMQNGTTPSGLISVSIDGKTAEMDLVGLDPKKSGKGLGAKLVEGVFADLKKKKFTECFVGTQLSNTKALRFYTKAGFEIDHYVLDFHFIP